MNQDFFDLLRSFIAHDVQFLVVGAYALAVHGTPRATGDFDLWVDATPENAPRVMRALAEFGAPMQGLTDADFAAHVEQILTKVAKSKRSVGHTTLESWLLTTISRSANICLICSVMLAVFPLRWRKLRKELSKKSGARRSI